MKKIIAIVLSASLGFGVTASAFAETLPQYENLPLAAREIIYQEKQVNASHLVALNLLPFASGSFGAGDWITGSLVSVLDATALFFLFQGMGAWNSPGGWGVLIGFGWAGTAYVAGRAIGVTSPWFYAPAHNAQLRQDLGLSPMSSAHPQASLAQLSYSFAF